jgi:hypothetical protein
MSEGTKCLSAKALRAKATPSPPDHSVGLRNSSGSFAILAAILRASSLLSSFAADRLGD